MHERFTPFLTNPMVIRWLGLDSLPSKPRTVPTFHTNPLSPGRIRIDEVFGLHLLSEPECSDSIPP